MDIKSNIFSPEVLKEKGVMKGFEYLQPERKEVVRGMEDVFRRVTESFGFREIEGPLLQPIEFYQVKSGDELLAHTYTFEDADGSVLVLRPELTPTVAYMIAKDDGRLNFPLKWWSNPDIFRKEKPQKGRKRQFKQLNVDIFDRGDSSREHVFDDAEVIAVGISIFESFGLDESDIVMKISSRSLLEKVFDAMNLDANQRYELLALIDKSEKITEEDFGAQLNNIIPLKESQSIIQSWLMLENLDALANDGLLGYLCETDEYKDLQKVFDLMEAYELLNYCKFAPNIVRGLGYYTGTVFEAFDRKTEYGFRRALMGGGRYDNLTKDMGGSINVTGVGFGFGNVPLEEILKARDLEITSSKARVDYYVITQSSGMQLDIIRIAKALRNQGKNVVLDKSIAKINPDNITKQLARSNQIYPDYSILIFPDEWAEGKVVVKNMRSGEQQTVNVDSILSS